MAENSPSTTASMSDDESSSISEEYPSSITGKSPPMTEESSSSSDESSSDTEDRSSTFEEWILMAQEEESPPLAEQWSSMVEEWIKTAQEDAQQEMCVRAEDLTYINMVEESSAMHDDWLFMEEIYARELAEERSLKGGDWLSTSIYMQKEAVDESQTYYPLSIGTLSRLKSGDHWHDHRIRALGHVRDDQRLVLRSVDEDPVQSIRLDITYATAPVVFHQKNCYQVYGRVLQCQKSDSVYLVVDFARVMLPSSLESYKEELFCIEQVGTSCEGCTQQRINLAETKDSTSPRIPPEYTNVWGEI